ncbi:MAG: hypothetical protein AAFX08_04545 [Pseudomonadota bacterium]
MSNAPSIEGFLGEWILDPSSCRYEQGEPPKSGRYVISRLGDDLAFRMEWIDADGAAHEQSFVSRPDGRPEVFNGGDLADALTTTTPAEGVLETRASYRGQDRMTALRTLSVDGMSMEVIQTVTLPDLSEVSNRAVYGRAQ